jgi:hypothetical protein
MKPMALKYMFLPLSRCTAAALATSAGFGAFGSEPSVATSAGVDIGGENCALPKMYDTNE